MNSTGARVEIASSSLVCRAQSDRSLSIIIPCRNEVGHIRSFIDSILNQDLGDLECEIIVADGESDDGTREILEEYRAKYPQISIITNYGKIVSAGLNEAIRQARGDVIIRMDAHTEYAMDYCRRSMEILEQTGADNVGGPARTKASGMVGRAIAAAYHSRFSTGGAKFHNEQYEGFVDTVPYGCWRKATLEGLGLFDEALVRNQDDELNLRLIRAGGKIWQSPAIVSWYMPRSSLSSLYRQYFQYGFWKVAVMRKHRVPASWRHLAPPSFVLGNVLLLMGSLWGMAARIDWLAAGALPVWGALLSIYVTAILVSSCFAARRHGWSLLPILPLVFAIYHSSYGVGFLSGLACFYKSSRYPSPVAAQFTQLSR